MRRPPSSESGARETRSAERARSVAGIWCASSATSIRLFVFLDDLGAESEVVNEYADRSGDDTEVAEPFQRMLPQLDQNWHARILRQTAVGLGIGGVVQNVDDVCSRHTGGIINA